MLVLQMLSEMWKVERAVGTVTGSTTQIPSKLTISQETLRNMMAAGVAMTPELNRVISEFWGLPVHLQCFSISPENLYFWRLDEFHVSQLVLEPNHQKMLQLRLSDMACSALLTQVLGARPITNNSFKFNRMSHFEAELMNRFSKNLMSTLVKGLLKRPSTYSKKESLVHLIWLMKLDFPEPGESHAAGKIILSLPAEALQTFQDTQLHTTSNTPWPEHIFDHAHTDATLQIGKTRIRLEELQALENGDVVVLENSHISQMFLLEPLSQHLFPFTATIRNPQAIEMPYTQEIAMMEKQHDTISKEIPPKETLWDNLLIDVSAEFLPTRLPLSHLRQMSEGLVVEIGDLIHNQVRLHVEGKTFAKGELVIVGDKFGVRLQELVEESEETTASPVTPMEHTLPPAITSQQAIASPLTEENFPETQEPLEEPDTLDALDHIDQFLNDDFDENAFGSDDEEEW